MEKGKRIEADVQLPEAIIQHIQSFLSGKEAAQTTVFSKSWYTAWLTRPNLDFDQRDFVRFHNNLGDEKQFWEFVKKTVQRYDKFNLKIESLRLSIHGTCSNKARPFCFSDCFSCANELVVKAMKMGAIDLNFNINCTNMEFTLPHDVLGSVNLIRLSVGGCKIETGENEKVCCSRLKSLSLDRMWVEGDTIWNIISSCHLIEKLSLSGSRLLSNTQSCTSDADLVLNSKALALSPFIEFGKLNMGSVVDGPINLHEFHKLKYLFLEGVNVHTLFFNDFSSKFPCMKDLALNHCDSFKKLHISSPSLERINFTQRKMLRVKFDVPSIRKFTFSGNHVPSLSFNTTRSNWESDISISCSASPKVTWFLNLNRFLAKLSLSRVSLSLKMPFLMSVNHLGKFQVSFKPVVESLTVNVPFSEYPALFDALFECCRPVFVTHESMYGQNDLEEVKRNDIRETVHKRFIQEGSLIWNSANQSSSGPCDLEEVNVEHFDEAVSAWWPLFFDSSTSILSLGAKQRFRLRLRLGRKPATLK